MIPHVLFMYVKCPQDHDTKKIILLFRLHAVQKRSKAIHLPANFSGKKKNTVVYLVERMIISGRKRKPEAPQIFQLSCHFTENSSVSIVVVATWPIKSAFL